MEKLANESFKSLLAPMPMSMLMDEDDAKECLNFVVDKVMTRKRKADEEAAAAIAAKELAAQRAGAARAAKRAEIANRPVKTRRVVDNYGRASVY